MKEHCSPQLVRRARSFASSPCPRVKSYINSGVVLTPPPYTVCPLTSVRLYCASLQLRTQSIFSDSGHHPEIPLQLVRPSNHPPHSVKIVGLEQEASMTLSLLVPVPQQTRRRTSQQISTAQGLEWATTIKAIHGRAARLAVCFAALHR